MKVSISDGNMKIGKTINISLPPIEACGKHLPCFEKCYALKSYRQYPNVRKAWGGNLEIYKKDKHIYWEQICNALIKTKRKYFRWHVAGDILDQEYLNNIVSTAEHFPAIKFLAHTKRFDLNYPNTVPDNLFIGFSTWPGMEVPKTAFLKTWLSHDERKPKQTFKCEGSCEECRYCWGEGKRVGDIEFKLH